MRAHGWGVLLLLCGLAAQAQEVAGVATPGVATPGVATPGLATPDAAPSSTVYITGSAAMRSAMLAKGKALSRGVSQCARGAVDHGSSDDALMIYLRDANLLDGADSATPPQPTTMADATAALRRAELRASAAEFAATLQAEARHAEMLMPAMAPMAEVREDTLGCGKSDGVFSAGFARIVRDDTSLIEAFQALDRKDYASARQQFEVAWKKIGYEEAALMLGKLYLRGLGVARDQAQAVKWLQEVLDQRYDPSSDRLRFDPGNPGRLNVRSEAILTLARLARAAGDRRGALKRYEQALDGGYLPAANLLGQAYLSGGSGLAVRQVLSWLKDSAEAGHAPSQYTLGRLYYAGADGVARDLPRAGAWFVAAANTGNVDALLQVARMYDAGEGVAPDQARAIVYYKEAAVKGSGEAQSALATYFYSGQQVARDLVTARRLFGEAARRGQADAMFNLGVMAVHGEGGPKDAAMGYVWLRLAQASAYPQAGAALREVEPLLSADERARAEALLKPVSQAKAG